MDAMGAAHSGPGEGEVVVRVLLVEDDKSLAEVTKRGLVSAGFVVDHVDNGEDALLAVRDGGYNAVVLDIMIPKLNGYKVVELMRKHKIWTPVLMLTAKDGVYDEVDAFDLGADDYLTKPFSFQVLVARLRALIRRGAPERPTVLEAGSLTLDPGRHHVERRGQVIELTAKEFQVLRYLMSDVSQARSRAQILEQCWDSSYEGDPNIVEVYIGYVRKKIDAPFGLSSLRTVRGVGYALDPVD